MDCQQNSVSEMASQGIKEVITNNKMDKRKRGSKQTLTNYWFPWRCLMVSFEQSENVFKESCWVATDMELKELGLVLRDDIISVKSF